MRPVIIAPFSPPSLACIRSWGRQGWETGFVCVQSSTCSAPKSKYLADWVGISQDKLFTASGIKLINNFLIKFNADGVFCISENVSQWIMQNKNEFPKKLKFFSPDISVLSSLSCKINQINIANTLNFRVLPTYFLNKNSVIDIEAKHFPLCLRPAQPESIDPGFKVKVVQSNKEIEYLFKSAKSFDGFVVGQPFKDFPNVVIHGTRDIQGKTSNLQGFIVERKFEGVALTVCPFEIDLSIKSKCILFVEKFQITGTFHFDFLFDNENTVFYFLELNPRLGGTTAKVFKCGYDEPSLMAESYGNSINYYNIVSKMTVASHTALIKYILFHLCGKENIIDYPYSDGKIKKIFFGLKFFLILKDDIASNDDIIGTFSLYSSNFTEYLMRFILLIKT